MKARVKATGEIVEAMYSHISQDGEYDIVWYVTLQGLFSKEELEFIDTGESLDYYTRLEHQYAGMAMQGILACEEWKISPREGVSFEGEVALQAHELAHALIQKLKEKGE